MEEWVVSEHLTFGARKYSKSRPFSCWLSILRPEMMVDKLAAVSGIFPSPSRKAIGLFLVVVKTT